MSDATASGTRHLSDAEFVEAMEALTLPDEAFRHFDHVRLAWIFLRTEEPQAASARMRRTIRRFAGHHGAPQMYHETITLAYMRFVAAHIARQPELDDFDRFAAAHPELLDRGLPLRHYSRDRLMSAEARAGWVEPDLRPLP
jgi:hypothetical protein